jgi:hypothetical protein
MSQISMFLAQSGPMSMSLLARSTMAPAMVGGARPTLAPEAALLGSAGFGSGAGDWVRGRGHRAPPDWPRVPFSVGGLASSNFLFWLFIGRCEN